MKGKTIELDLTPQAHNALVKLASSGIHGRNVKDVATRIIDEGIAKKLEGEPR